MNWDVFWSAVVVVVGGAFGAFDYWRAELDKKKGTQSTFSDYLRRLFRTDKVGGKVAFGAFIFAVAATLWHHIDFGSWL